MDILTMDENRTSAESQSLEAIQPSEPVPKLALVNSRKASNTQSMRARAHVHTNACMHSCKTSNTQVYTHKYTHAHTHTHTHAHTHTHTHTQGI